MVSVKRLSAVWTPVTVVSRSSTILLIATFMLGCVVAGEELGSGEREQHCAAGDAGSAYFGRTT